MLRQAITGLNAAQNQQENQNEANTPLPSLPDNEVQEVLDQIPTDINRPPILDRAREIGGVIRDFGERINAPQPNDVSPSEQYGCAVVGTGARILAEAVGNYVVSEAARRIAIVGTAALGVPEAAPGVITVGVPIAITVAQPVINKIGQATGDYAERHCHAAFASWNKLASPISAADATLQSTSHGSFSHDRYQTNHYSGRDYLHSQFKDFSDLGYPKNNAPTEFYGVLQALGLDETYNQMHSFNSCPSLPGQHGFIGGVVSRVGIMEGLKDSATDVLFDEHIICLPISTDELAFNNAELQQIARELQAAIQHPRAHPFVHLGMNKNGINFAAMHDFYKDKLVGHIMLTIDHFLKGFVNGGIFSEDFLRNWPAAPNTDNKFLKKHLLDLKELYEKDKQIYLSFREKMCQAGFELNQAQHLKGDELSIFHNKFNASFRIEVKLDRVQMYENTFLIKPDFEVKYTIEETAEYKKYCADFRKQHGKEPLDYQKLRRLFENECKSIKEKMPKLPVFRKYFQLLGLINFFCYYLTTLQDMGKSLDVSNVPLTNPGRFPNVLPPIPVRYYQSRPITITLANVLDSLDESTLALLNPFLRQNLDMPAKDFPCKLKTALMTDLRKLLPTDMNEEDVQVNALRLYRQVKRCLKNRMLNIKQDCDDELKALTKKYNLEISIENISTITQKFAALREACGNNHPDLRRILNYFEADLNNIYELAKPYDNSENLLQHVHESTIEIADENYYQHSSGHYRVVGGCSMNLANVQIQPMQENMAKTLASHAKALAPESMAQVNYQDENYVVFKLRTKNTLTLDHKDSLYLAAQQTLTMGDAEIHALSELKHEQLTQEKAILRKFDPASKDIAGQTLLHYLARFGKAKQLQNVVQGQTNTLTMADNYGDLPIHAAAFSGNVEALRYFAKKMPMLIHAKNNNGTTPLMLAAQNGHTQAVIALLALGARVEDSLPCGLFALYLAIQGGHTETALVLIAKKVNLDAVLPNGNSALHLAIETGQEQIALALITNSADGTLKRSTDGYTAYHCAAQQGMMNVCIELLKSIDVNTEGSNTWKNCRLSCCYKRSTSNFAKIASRFPRRYSFARKSNFQRIAACTDRCSALSC